MLSQHLARDSGYEPLQFQKSASTTFSEMPENQRFPFSADDGQRRFHRAFTKSGLGYLHHTALQNSAFLLGLFNRIVFDAELHLRAQVATKI
jgi:hypothetical protein